MDIRKIDLQDERIISIEIISDDDFFESVFLRVWHEDNCLVIKCKECYSANVSCHMYIKGDDTIRALDIEDVEVEQYISKYPEKKIKIPLKSICINTNISNSNIQILAKEILCYYEVIEGSKGQKSDRGKSSRRGAW